MEKVQLIMFLVVSVALVFSAHKRASIVSAAVIGLNFIVGHILLGGLSWLSVLNFACLAVLLVANRLIANKWWSACSIIVYSIVIDSLTFAMGMAFGAAGLFEYVWAGILFNAPKLVITLPVAVVWQVMEMLPKRSTLGQKLCEATDRKSVV